MRKRVISLLTAISMMCTMLTAFSVNASADDISADSEISVTEPIFEETVGEETADEEAEETAAADEEEADEAAADEEAAEEVSDAELMSAEGDVELMSEGESEVLYVAQIGETKYETLVEAITKAVDGDTLNYSVILQQTRCL